MTPDAPSLGQCLTNCWPHGCGAAAIDALVDGLGTGVAAFFGAWIALLLQERATRRRESAQELEDLRFAQLTIILQLNTMRNLLEQHLDPLRAHPHRHFVLHPIGNSAPRIAVDLHKLSFALQVDDPDLIQEVHLANLRYFSALDALLERNREHLAFQDRYRHIRTEQFVPDQHTAMLLKDHTENLYSAVDAAAEQAPEIIRRLAKMIKKRHPKAKVLAIDPIPKAESA